MSIIFFSVISIAFCLAIFVNPSSKAIINTDKLLINELTVNNEKLSEIRDVHHLKQSDTLSVEEESWIFHEIKNLDRRQSLSDLLIAKEIEDIFYGDLLNCFEWRIVRLKVLLRHQFQCQRCNNYSESNHIHHTYYVQDHLPWDIAENSLQTLCPSCHRMVHETTKIPIKAKAPDGSLYESTSVSLVCYRCGGHGYLPQFSHVQAGICFKCYGHKTRNQTFKSILNTHLEQLSFYNDVQRRLEYKNFLIGLKPEMLKCLKIVKKPEGDDDDLPF
ncbi:hypothetical protein GCM10011387_16050 [Pedobacter quisquiliarum]|uniref:HNH domain-containing protein n=1 Tax=Pedobacter quisquiliarum TaxID=1834438 RepID=A0A916XC76_9SPHI|nr:HNH endonuclease [Pedobacter quisquiliarum]GGC63226.1 hypothetical protein GCM10011387_16050 [Pedobacter quisquiliarum]